MRNKSALPVRNKVNIGFGTVRDLSSGYFGLALHIGLRDPGIWLRGSGVHRGGWGEDAPMGLSWTKHWYTFGISCIGLFVLSDNLIYCKISNSITHRHRAILNEYSKISLQIPDCGIYTIATALFPGYRLYTHPKYVYYIGDSDWFDQ